MSLAPGTRIGPYEIVGLLGAGGMGEVYRGRDARLGRDVALKVLRAGFAADPERLTRFEREAQVLAQLRHPGIGAIYGFEEGHGADGHNLPALVLELIEGDTLADRIARGPLPLDEAAAIARQIADAVEAAHDRGVIHRDLKPSNIKVTAGGDVKVLDFGLAKLNAPATDGAVPSIAADVTASPTVALPPAMTGVGIILGTAPYMAPEQAKGQSADKRSDVWAYGCILYEMLTGRRAFPGDDVSETLAAVLGTEPDWSALPASTPPAIRRLLRRCLARDPRRRLRDIADARLELDVRDPVPPPVVHQTRSRRLALIGGVLVVAVAALAGAAAWTRPAAAPSPLRKLDVTADLTSAAIPEETGFESPVRLSPDGSRAAYIARNHLWVRDFDRASARDLGELPAGSYTLAWSPDGAFIGFASADNKYRKIAISGGPAVIVCDLPATGRITGAAWLPGDTIVLAAWRESLYRVSADGGGTPDVWLKVDPAREIDFHNPEPLPGGRVMFRTHTRGLGADEVDVVEQFDGTTRAVMLREQGVGPVAYAPPGYLLFVRQSGGGSLWAAPIDALPVSLSNAFLVDGQGQGVTAGSDGTVLIANSTSTVTARLVRVDRSGREIEELVPAGPTISDPLFSPDGRAIAYHSHAGGNPDVWVLDLARKATTRLTFDSGEDIPSSWLPTGEAIVYARKADEVEGGEITTVAADGSGTQRALTKGTAGFVSPDGKYLVYIIDERGQLRIRYAERRPDGTFGDPQRLVRSDPEPSQVFSMSLSPDGRLLAYEQRGTDERGVFLTRFPSGEGRWQIDGAAAPVRNTLPIGWSRAASELLFFGSGQTPGSLQLMAAPISTDPTVTIGRPVPLFAVEEASVPAGFDVAPDGQSIVIGRRVGEEATRTKYTLVENWFREFAGRTR
jgi:serine/threonine-protein kinase